MNKFTYMKHLTIIVIISILYGCGEAYVRTDVQSQDLKEYDNILIQNVRVYSKEAAAKNNVPLQEKLKSWEEFSRNELEGYVNRSQYKLVKSLENVSGQTLIVDLDVNVQYGNRALRWAVGFGAGKGGVDSTLTVKDARTGEVKFQAEADSDLSMGGAGGDIGEVLEDNIRELIEQLKDS
jgi:hypothetical protein